MSEIANDALSNIDEPETTSLQDDLETTSLQDDPETTSLQDDPETTSLQDEPETTSELDEPETTSELEDPETTSLRDEPETTSEVDDPETTSEVDEPETTSEQGNLVSNTDEQPDVIVVDTVIIKTVKQPVPVPPDSKTGSEQDLEFLKTIAKLNPIVGTMLDSVDRVNARQPDSGPAPDPKDFIDQEAGAIKNPGHPPRQLG